MSKKIKFIYSFVLILLLICLGLDIINIYPRISFLGCAYFVSFLILALFLIFRGAIFKIDTNLYFGILLLISPLIQLLIYFGVKNYILYTLLIFSVLTIASFTIWRYFKDKTHKMAFFVFLGEIVILLIAFYLTKISFWYLILIMVIWFMLFVGVNLVSKKMKKR